MTLRKKTINMTHCPIPIVLKRFFTSFSSKTGAFLGAHHHLPPMDFLPAIFWGNCQPLSSEASFEWPKYMDTTVIAMHGNCWGCDPLWWVPCFLGGPPEGTFKLTRLIWVFPKIGVPQIIHFNKVFHYKTSILGYPYFWKHPYEMSHLNGL